MSTFDAKSDKRIEDGDRTPRANSPRPLRSNEISGSAHIQYSQDTPLGRAQQIARDVLQPKPKPEVGPKALAELRSRAAGDTYTETKSAVDLLSEISNKLQKIYEPIGNANNNFSDVVMEKANIPHDTEENRTSIQKEKEQDILDMLDIEIEKINTEPEYKTERANIPPRHKHINEAFLGFENAISQGTFQRTFSNVKDAMIQTITHLQENDPEAFKYFDHTLQDKFDRDKTWKPINDLVEILKRERKDNYIKEAKSTLDKMIGFITDARNFEGNRNAIVLDIHKMQKDPEQFKHFSDELHQRRDLNEIWDPLVRLVSSVTVVDRTGQ